MKESQFYSCAYCSKEYEPKRRRVQKYCSDTCRSKAYHARKTKSHMETTNQNNKLTVPEDVPPTKTTQMSMAGVGNAATGALIADGLKSLLTKESNKPATKGDLEKLIEKLNGRYHIIKNIPPNEYGEYAYYDLLEGIFVYL